MDYRNKNERNYYGSDYNKYLRKECRKNMTVINIDCVQLDWNKKILRVIESKHFGEHMDKSSPQFKVLYLLAKVFKFVNRIARQYNFQIYLVIGNYPYNELIVENLVTHNVALLTGSTDVKQFSELDLMI